MTLHTESSAVHGVPAFVCGLLVGSFSLGACVSAWSSWHAGEFVGVVGIGVTFSVLSVALIPLLGLIFALVFFALRALRIVNIVTFTFSGAGIGLLLVLHDDTGWFLGMTSYILIAAMFLSGAMGGLAAFGVLKRLSMSGLDS